MAATEMADDGVQIPVYSIPMQFSYAGGNISAITVSYGFNTYKQTFTYSGADVIAITRWEKQ